MLSRLCRFEEMHWQRVEVGDIVLLKNNDFVTVSSRCTAAVVWSTVVHHM